MSYPIYQVYKKLCDKDYVPTDELSSKEKDLIGLDIFLTSAAVTLGIMLILAAAHQGVDLNHSHVLRPNFIAGFSLVLGGVGLGGLNLFLLSRSKPAEELDTFPEDQFCRS